MQASCLDLEGKTRVTVNGRGLCAIEGCPITVGFADKLCNTLTIKENQISQIIIDEQKYCQFIDKLTGEKGFIHVYEIRFKAGSNTDLFP